MLTERPPHRPLLDHAEGGLTLVDEDLGDGPTLLGDDVIISVPVGDPQPLGQQEPNGGLAHTHRTDQDHQRAAHRMARLSRYDVTLRRVSATESPPNFSATASANTRATIASATMPAAGTADTSERW